MCKKSYEGGRLIMKKRLLTITAFVVSLGILNPLSCFAFERTDDEYGTIVANLESDSYGGAYIKDGVLHIKPLSEQIKPRLVKTSGNAQVVFDDIAQYSMEELNKAMEESVVLFDELDIDFVGIDEENNGLRVGMIDVTEEKKERFCHEIAIDNILFEEVSAYEGRWEDSVYECKYYGDSDATLSLPTITLPYNINVDDIEKDAAEIKYIKEDIFIDIEKRNFSELENYLERNIAGFSADKFILNQDRIHDVGENDYFLYYEFFENGFKSPYFVAVSCEDGSPEMFSFNFTKENIDQFTQAQRIGINEISEDTIEKAKYWALQEINDDSYVVKEQTVTPRVDDKGNHSLYVRTTVQYVLDGDCFDKLYVYTYPLD